MLVFASADRTSATAVIDLGADKRSGRNITGPRLLSATSAGAGAVTRSPTGADSREAARFAKRICGSWRHQTNYLLISAGDDDFSSPHGSIHKLGKTVFGFEGTDCRRDGDLLNRILRGRNNRRAVAGRIAG